MLTLFSQLLMTVLTDVSGNSDLDSIKLLLQGAGAYHVHDVLMINIGLG